MKTHYLLDHEYSVDEDKLFGSMGHLLAFNPGPRDADLDITLYFEDRDPKTFPFVAPAGKSSETNYTRWPIEPDVRFALKVESTEPMVCQSTVGWNNSKNDYSPDAETKSPCGLRECAKSYISITEPTRQWYLADSTVIDGPGRMYVRESEWAVLLNPGDQKATVTLYLHYDEVMKHTIEVSPRRLKIIYMDDIAQRNQHCGVHFESDQPIAAQWLRAVNWYDNEELMTYWSVPCVPGPLA